MVVRDNLFTDSGLSSRAEMPYPFSLGFYQLGSSHPWCRIQFAHALVQAEQGWSLARTPKSWAAVA